MSDAYYPVDPEKVEAYFKMLEAKGHKVPADAWPQHQDVRPTLARLRKQFGLVEDEEPLPDWVTETDPKPGRPEAEPTRPARLPYAEAQDHDPPEQARPGGV